VALTFDDGYQDVLGDAAAVLRGHGAPATVFVTTAGLEAEAPWHHWWDVLEAALLDPQAATQILSVPLPEGPVRYRMSTRADREAAHDALHHALVRLSACDRTRAIEAVVGWSGRDLRLPCRLTRDELTALARIPGFSIGAHTVHHVALPFQPPETQRREIVSSRAHLADLLGRAPDAFAYPYGAWNGDTAATVRDAGFTLGLTCDEGLCSARSQPFAVPRIEVRPGTAERLAAALERHFTQAADAR
jgi:peptidoglycan/xylan/chitin deacetylase (PgdA/CDA1 family)